MDHVSLHSSVIRIAGRQELKILSTCNSSVIRIAGRQGLKLLSTFILLLGSLGVLNKNIYAYDMASVPPYCCPASLFHFYPALPPPCVPPTTAAHVIHTQYTNGKHCAILLSDFACKSTTKNNKNNAPSYSRIITWYVTSYMTNKGTETRLLPHTAAAVFPSSINKINKSNQTHARYHIMCQP